MTARLPIILGANTRTISPHPSDIVPMLIAAAGKRGLAPVPGMLGRQHPQPAHAPGQRPRRGGFKTWR
jgi:hypothetical protein